MRGEKRRKILRLLNVLSYSLELLSPDLLSDFLHLVLITDKFKKPKIEAKLCANFLLDQFKAGWAKPVEVHPPCNPGHCVPNILQTTVKLVVTVAVTHGVKFRVEDSPS